MNRLVLFLIAVLALFPRAEHAQAQDANAYSRGYAGTLPTDPRLKAGQYFAIPAVRSLIRALEGGPLSADQVRRALEGTDDTPEDLVRVGLLAKRGDDYRIAFNYFTRDDMKAIHRVVEERSPLLARAFESRRATFDRILSRYPVHTVSTKNLAFALISGVSLNWDGLSMTEDLGFRKPEEVSGKGWHYSFWAAYDDPDYSTHGFFWGSSTFPSGTFNFEDDPADFVFTSFGDPYSEPRMNFPDLFYTPAGALAPPVSAAADEVGTVRETHFGLDIQDVLGLERSYDVATVLFALRHGPENQGQLAGKVRDADALPALMDLLETVQYVSRDDSGSYHLLVPVFDTEDQEFVDAALTLSEQTIRDWLLRNYPDIRDELSGLTALKQGVPFESLFTQIWHDLFGRVTRELAATGFTADPYGADVVFKGSLGMVWRRGLFRTPFD